MRLFIGIALPEGATAALQAAKDGLERLSSHESGLRWSLPESWHVTLQFLGQTSEETAQCAMEKLASVRAERVPVRLEGLGFFQRAGVFWAGVALTSELLALQQKIVAAMRGCGFVPEARDYRPHITLARVTGRGGKRALGELKQAVEGTHPVREPHADKDGAPDFYAAFIAEAFVLYESLPGPEGSRYEVRGSWGLGAGG